MEDKQTLILYVLLFLLGFQMGYFFDNVILPLAMILYVILHFRNDKNIYLYAILMGILFFTVPVWFLIVVGLFLMGLNTASKWAKDRLHGRS